MAFTNQVHTALPSAGFRSQRPTPGRAVLRAARSIWL